MDEPITARFEWNADAMTEAMAAHRRHSLRPVVRALLILFLGLYVVGTVGIPLWLVVDSRISPETRRNAFVAFAVVSLAWVWLIGGIYNNRFLRWKARRVFRSIPGGPQFVEWSIGPDQLSNRTTNSASTLLWPLYVKVVEDRNGFMLYQSVQLFNWIPGHAFASEGELRRFADLARARVANYVVVGECRFIGKPQPLGFEEL
jgi:hypothetical protein